MRHAQRSLVLSILISVIANFCCAQTWQALNPPLNLFNGTIYSTTVDKSGNIYAAGDFKNSSYNNFVAKWNGTSWNELGSGRAALNANGAILTLATRGDTVYAAGAFTNKLNHNYVAKWNGTSWSELDSNASMHADGGHIYSITADRQGNVYAAGRFTNAAGSYYVAKWDGHSWSELGSGSNALNANNDIFTVATDTLGNVYAAGFFTNALGKYYVAKWDGHSWSELGRGSNPLNASGFINCLATDINGNVYAGGTFMNSSNEYYLAKWNGTKWSETGSGGNTLHANGAIKSVAINNKNEVYVAGYFADGLRYYVAKWNEVSWSPVDNMQSLLPANDPIQSITVDANDNLYAGGKFLNKSGHAFVAKWNKTDWNEMGSEGDPFYSNQPIYQIVADSTGNVYVSGDFNDNGGRSYLEHWNGRAWNELGVPDTSGLFIYSKNTGQMAVDSKGNLYVTGRRNTGLNTGYDCILKWDGAKWTILEDFPNSLGTHNDNPVYGISEIEIDRQGNIYVLGSFIDSAYHLYSLAKWNGKSWSRLPALGYIDNFCVASDGNIYAYGSFNNQNTIANYNPANNYYLQEVQSGNSTIRAAGSNVFTAIATDSKSNLYVNGRFTDSAGKRYIAKWDGKSWSEFGLTDNLGWVLAIDRSDNIYSSNDRNFGGDGAVKKWNGVSWVDVGTPAGANDIFPDGSVLATDPLGNIFTIAPSYEPGIGGYIVRYAPISFASPQLSSFTPATGSVGTTVTITGKNLTGTAQVTFGGTKARSFIVHNDSTITAVVANGSTGSVLVNTAHGVDSLRTFVYTCDSVKGPVPSISLAGDSVLVSSYANNYQWYYNNHKLNNEISNSVHIVQAGFYHVETSEDKVCWVRSQDYPVLISRTSPDSLQLSVYPNPSHGNFTAYVKLPKITTVKAYVQVTDVNGVQILQTSKLIFYGNQIRIPVSINAKGSFFVKVFVNDDAVQQSIIIL
jgi:hypothetical protein